MSNILKPGSGVLFMKVGVHARESLEDIIERKTKEIEDAGYALWGYGGNTCHPTTMVQPFAERKLQQGFPVHLCMQEMKSNHFAEPIRASKMSSNGTTWQVIDPKINVVGSRYALVIKSLRTEEFTLPLNHAHVAVGPSRGKTATQYIKGRVDKACFELDEMAELPLPPSEPVVQINLAAELLKPYAVFLK